MYVWRSSGAQRQLPPGHARTVMHLQAEPHHQTVPPRPRPSPDPAPRPPQTCRQPRTGWQPTKPRAGHHGRAACARATSPTRLPEEPGEAGGDTRATAGPKSRGESPTLPRPGGHGIQHAQQDAPETPGHSAQHMVCAGYVAACDFSGGTVGGHRGGEVERTDAPGCQHAPAPPTAAADAMYRQRPLPCGLRDGEASEELPPEGADAHAAGSRSGCGRHGRDFTAPSGHTGAVVGHSVSWSGGEAAAANVLRPLPTAGDIGGPRESLHASLHPSAGGRNGLADLAVCGSCPGGSGAVIGEGRVECQSAGTHVRSLQPAHVQVAPHHVSGSRLPDGTSKATGLADTVNAGPSVAGKSRPPLPELQVSAGGVASGAPADGCRGGDPRFAQEQQAAQEMQRATVPAHAHGAVSAAVGADVRAVRGSLSLERVSVRGRRPARQESLDTATDLQGRVHASLPSGVRFQWGRVSCGPPHGVGLQGLHRELATGTAVRGWRGAHARDGLEFVPLRSGSLEVWRDAAARVLPGQEHADGMHGRKLCRGGSLGALRSGRWPTVGAGSLQDAAGAHVMRGAKEVEGWQRQCVGPGLGSIRYGSSDRKGSRKVEAPRDTVMRLLRTAAQNDA